MERNLHSTADYFQSIFAKFAKSLAIGRIRDAHITVMERLEDVWLPVKYPDAPKKNVFYDGYFQTADQFADQFNVPKLRELLCIDQLFKSLKLADRFPDLDRSLLHVRRGDYTSEAHNIHLVDLKLYQRIVDFDGESPEHSCEARGFTAERRSAGEKCACKSSFRLRDRFDQVLLCRCL